jgi:hypothetical protein
LLEEASDVDKPEVDSGFRRVASHVERLEFVIPIALQCLEFRFDDAMRLERGDGSLFPAKCVRNDLHRFEELDAKVPGVFAADQVVNDSEVESFVVEA